MKQTHLDLFQTLKDASDATSEIEQALLILCTPRCGSTLFAEVLNNTGRLGCMDEWWNNEYFDAWREVTGLEFNIQTYMNWVARKTVADTGVFCLKLHIGQLVAINQEYNLGVETMDFKHVVYLYRRDKIAQAVSLARAVKTDQFRSYEEATEEPEITRKNIADALQIIAMHDEFARKHLWKYVDAEYAYEDFQHYQNIKFKDNVTRPIGREIYNETLLALGKEPCYTFSAGRLKKQRTKDTEALASDFRRYIDA